MAIKYVLLDLDDTLFDFHKSESVSLAKTLPVFGIKPTEENVALYSKINRQCWQALERGEMTRDEVLRNRFGLFFDALGVVFDPDKARNLYEGYLSECCHMIDGAMDLILRLHGKYVLAIASNGTAAVQDKRLSVSGITKFFDHIFISERMGADKPSPTFFENCLKVLGEPSRNEVVIVGDSLSSDIKGGIGVGIHTVLYDPKKTTLGSNIQAEYTAYSLSDVPEIIDIIK